MTASAGRQLTLDLAHRPARGREDFLVTPSSRAAVGLIDMFPNWQNHAVAIVGPAGSGKSHLLEVWCGMSGAALAPASELHEENVPALLASGALAIDDAPGASLDERALFHLLNLARQDRAHVLIASNSHPAGWRIALPDLASRLKALPVAELGPPDDQLLRGVVVKLFADRQLGVDEGTVSYLLLRMPRSLEAAGALVAEIDRQALEEKAEITRGFVARVLQSFTAPGLFGPED
jgi:chromosomal replication initiation ATPase DnaA